VVSSGRPEIMLEPDVSSRLSSWIRSWGLPILCTNDDYNLWVWFCISRHEEEVDGSISLFLSLDLCSSSWQCLVMMNIDDRFVTFWCINDDCNLCVILHLKRHACVIICVQ
jgi:hypothetical protein